jgi:hypothetical protein
MNIVIRREPHWLQRLLEERAKASIPRYITFHRGACFAQNKEDDR